MGSCHSNLSVLDRDDTSKQPCLLQTCSSLASTDSEHMSPVTANGIYGGVELSCAPSLREASIDSSNSLGFGLTGLENLGNTCFLNSALQCLAATTPLNMYFLCFDWKSEINAKNPLGSGGNLVHAYARLLKKIWTQHHDCISPVKMYEQITTFCPEFQGFGQHDAQEALAFLLDGLHEDLNRVHDKPFVETLIGEKEANDESIAAASWRNYLLRNKSVIVDLFQGQLKSTLTCLHCDTKSIRFEPFMFLSLPVDPSNPSVEQSLRLFTTEERLESSQGWYCSHCKAFRSAKKKLDLWKLPSVLIIHLKRFDFDPQTGRHRKIQTPVTYPTTEMNLSSYLSTYQIEHASYELFSTANHHGTVGSGHYTSTIRNALNSNWYRISDHNVQPIGAASFDAAQNPDAYVLFYSRASMEKASFVRRQSVTMPQNWPHSPSVTRQF